MSSSLPVFVVLNCIRHDSPDAKVVFFRHLDGFEGGIGGDQIDGILLNPNEFEGEFTVDVANSRVSVLRVQGLVNDQNITIQNAGVLHGLAFDPAKKCAGRVGNQLLVQIEP